jgi:hypothetical protein
MPKTPHAIVITRAEENSKAYRDGRVFAHTSNLRRVQELVGKGGTLWVVTSHARPSGGRHFSLALELVQCRSETETSQTRFGRFSVVGDRLRSRFHASNDAKLLLMSLRFDPKNPKPIKTADKIGQSLQTARRLSPADVELLRSYARDADRWGVFISYRREDSSSAVSLAKALQREGIGVFRDQEKLRAGQKWWPVIRRVIQRSRFFVLLIGPQTHESEWVRKELACARRLGSRITIVPVLAGGSLRSWEREFPEISRLHALDFGTPSWRGFVTNLTRALARP